ncbi:MAG: guanylate kinase [Planctomycetaceae bacterium]|nr:MAG: guanylate kinase [Planctomycetaceae bacterium]
MQNTSDCGSGRVVIISGPSGAGKSTVVRQLRQTCPLPLATSISATTRKPRDGERDGVDYFFLSDRRFQELREQGAFLECRQNFGMRHWYGTLRDQVAAGLNAGKWLILEIDVLGAMEVLKHADLDPITIFIHPGGMDELERRLRERGTETEESLAARLRTAAAEMGYRSRYCHEVINETVPEAVDQICHLLQQAKERDACSKS